MSESTRPVAAPTRPRPRRRRRWPLLLLVCALGGGAFAAWHFTHRPHATVDPALVVTARREKLDIEITDVGRIEAPDTVLVTSRVPGRVTDVLVAEGERVKRGQLLVRLDRRTALEQLARARAELHRARAAHEFAARDAERKAQGAEQGIVARLDLESARHKARLAQLDVKLARVTLAEARDHLHDLELSSPISGTVTRRAIEPGEMVEKGVEASRESAALLTVADLSRLVVKTDLDQIDVAKVRLGQRVSVKLDALPDQSFPARVTKIAPASVQRTGKDVDVFPVEALLDKADPRVKPGMTGDVRISVREEPHVLALPLESVRKKHGKEFVTRVVSDAQGEHTEEVEVKLGAGNDHVVEVVSGIAEGQRVLVDPASAAKNETKI